jgi:isopropylmalate/homocitrate/citramalate synthase
VTSIRIASARGDLGVAAHERELAEHSESQRAMVHTIAELKRGHHDTIEIPICTMSELMESQRCP